MLETVIEQVQLRRKFFLRQQTGLVSIRSYNHRHLQFVSDEERLVTVLLGRTARIDNGVSERATAWKMAFRSAQIVRPYEAFSTLQPE